MAETVVAKASETEAVVQRRRKKRGCLHGGYIGGSQWNQRGSGDGGKKAAAVVVVAADGIWAVVLAMAKVAMALADNSGIGGAGNSGRNRGSGRATTINHNAAGVGGGGGGGGSRGWRSCRLQRQGQIVAVAAMVIAQFTLEGVRPDPRGTNLATYSNILDIFGICRFYLRSKIKLFAAPIIGATNNFICICIQKISHFVRLFAYRGNKITFFANRIRRLVMLWKKGRCKGAANANSVFCRAYWSNEITALLACIEA